eukprot:39759-Hanusia_phi.AAC.1
MSRARSGATALARFRRSPTRSNGRRSLSVTTRAGPGRRSGRPAPRRWPQCQRSWVPDTHHGYSRIPESVSLGQRTEDAWEKERDSEGGGEKRGRGMAGQGRRGQTLRVGKARCAHDSSSWYSERSLNDAQQLMWENEEHMSV